MKVALVIPRVTSRKALDLIATCDIPVFYLEHCSWFWRLMLARGATKISCLTDLADKYRFAQVFVLPLEAEDFELGANLKKFNQKDQSKFVWLGPQNDWEVLADKRLFQEFCEENSFPIASSAITGKKFVIKPSRGSGSRGVRFCGKAEALLKSKNKKYVVQQFVESDQPPFGFSGFADNGQIDFLIGHRRIVTSRRTTGSSLLARQIHVPEAVASVCQTMMEKLNFTGFFMVEMILSKRDEWIIIELNPRIWGSFRLGIRSINLCSLPPRFSLYEPTQSLLFLHGFLLRPLSLMTGLIMELVKNPVRCSPDLSIFLRSK